jgi:hypothetical protein
MRVFAIFAMSAVLAAAATQALPHQAASGWDYPFYCCSGADCARIEAEAVRETPTGFIVTVQPGKHPMWPAERRETLVLAIPHNKVMPAPDGQWHLCINDTGELLCFFAPGGDS